MHPVNPTPKPYFDPMISNVSAITRSNPAVVTTSAPHQFFSGNAIRMIIPTAFGMIQLDKKIFVIMVLSATTFSLNFSLFPTQVGLNSTFLDPFVLATGNLPQVAQAISIGSLPIQNSEWPYAETLINDEVFNTLLQSGGSQ